MIELQAQEIKNYCMSKLGAYETVFKSFSKKVKKAILERGESYEDSVWYNQ